jgi:hypothetical protein
VEVPDIASDTLILFASISADAVLQVLAGALAVLAAAFSVYVFTRRVTGVRVGGIEWERVIDEEAEEVRQRLAPEEGIGDSEREYRLLSEYHAQGLSQARISFRFSILFAALGFAVIAVAVFLALGSKDSSAAASTVSLVAGSIVEAVSALFFVQSNRARELMVSFFDRLRSDRRLRDALALAEGIDDERLRSRLQTQLALSLADSSDSEGTLDILLRPDA